MNKNELLYKWLQDSYMEKAEVTDFDLKGSDEDDCDGYIKMKLNGKVIEMKIKDGFRDKTFVFENNEKKEIDGYGLRLVAERR